MPLAIPAPTEVESYAREAAAFLGVEIDADDVPSVVAILGVLIRNAELLMTYDLPESIEAAPAIRIPAEPDE